MRRGALELGGVAVAGSGVSVEGSGDKVWGS